MGIKQNSTETKFGCYNFVFRLRQNFEFSNYTQKDLAEYLGVSEAVVSRWCRGKSEPSLRHFVQICEFFNVSASYLIRYVPSLTKIRG